MAFLIYVRNALRPDGVQAKLVYDGRDGVPELGDADKRAGVLDRYELPAADVAHPLDLLCRLYPYRAPTAAAAKAA